MKARIESGRWKRGAQNKHEKSDHLNAQGITDKRARRLTGEQEHRLCLFGNTL